MNDQARLTDENLKALPKDKKNYGQAPIQMEMGRSPPRGLKKAPQ